MTLEERWLLTLQKRGRELLARARKDHQPFAPQATVESWLGLTPEDFAAHKRVLNAVMRHDLGWRDVRITLPGDDKKTLIWMIVDRGYDFACARLPEAADIV